MTQITSLGALTGVTSVSISSIKMIAGEFSRANWKTSASGGRMSTSAFECWWATTQEVVWLWREACAGIKKVCTHPIMLRLSRPSAMKIGVSRSSSLL